MDIITDMFSVLGEILTGLLNLLVSSTSGVIEIFYAPEKGFSIYGIFLLFGLGMFFLMFAWRVIQGFIRK